MSTSNYEEVLNYVRQLSPDEQLRLLEELAAHVRQQITITEQPLHSFLELEGLGQEIWQGIDAQKYIEEERNSWE
jgi:dihydroneopterin aldolase